MGLLNTKCIMLNEKDQYSPIGSLGVGEEKVKEGIAKNGQGLSYGKFGQLKGHQ